MKKKTTSELYCRVLAAVERGWFCDTGAYYSPQVREDGAIIFPSGALHPQGLFSGAAQLLDRLQKTPDPFSMPPDTNLGPCRCGSTHKMPAPDPNISYIAVGDIAAHNGYIKKIYLEDEQTYTSHEIYGAFGTRLLESHNRWEAVAALEEFLKCDSVEEGTYCYTHNPTP